MNHEQPQLYGVSALDIAPVTPYSHIEMHSYVHSEDVTRQQIDAMLERNQQVRVGQFEPDEVFYSQTRLPLGKVALQFICKVGHNATNKDIPPTFIELDDNQA